MSPTFTGKQAYHALDNVLNFTDRQFQHQADGLFILAVLLDDLLEQLFRLFAVLARFNCGVACDRGILLYRTKADNLIAVVHQLIKQPLERKVRIIVLVGSTEKRATAASRLVAFVLVVQGQRKVRGVGVVERVEGNAALVGSRSAWD